MPQCACWAGSAWRRRLFWASPTTTNRRPSDLPFHNGRISSRMPLGRIPVIDYERHPAFEGIRASSDAAAEALIAEINETYRRRLADVISPELLVAAFDRDIALRIAQLAK